MEGLNYVALASPAFFLLIGIELWVARRRGASLYRFNDSVTNLGCGLSQQVLLLFMTGAMTAMYVYAYDHARVFTIRPSAGTWVLAFVAMDFLHYVWHRASHRVNLLWTAHVVHHESEEFNYSVALRQTFLSEWTIQIFYLPLALAGFPVSLYLTVYAANLLYGFVLHTRVVPKLGPLEWLFNTPSHHRVHHGVNARYLDRNFWSTFIVFDRLFGTFEPESEPVRFGLVHPVRSFSPLRTHLHHWIALARMSRRAPRWFDKVLLWLAPPDWQPSGLEATAAREEGAHAEKFDPPVVSAIRPYVAVQAVVATTVTVTVALFVGRLSWERVALAAAVLHVTFYCWGALLEAKPWARTLERARLAIAALAAIGWFWTSAYREIASATIALSAALFAWWLARALPASGGAGDAASAVSKTGAIGV
jgi:alkylglycerol monooxygenase